MNLFKLNIRYLRRKFNLSQGAFGEIFGYDRGRISSWEQGRGFPSAENLILITDHFDVSMDDLMKVDMEYREQDQERKDAYKSPEALENHRQISVDDDQTSMEITENSKKAIELKENELANELANDDGFITIKIPTSIIDKDLLNLIASYYANKPALNDEK